MQPNVPEFPSPQQQQQQQHQEKHFNSTARASAKAATANSPTRLAEVAPAKGPPYKSDILLNNFEINKKRYCVLLKGDHIAWERLDSKKGKRKSSNKKSPLEDNDNDAAVRRDGENARESETLSQSGGSDTNSYGPGCRMVRVTEIIRVTKGHSKAASLRVSATTNYDSLTPTISGVATVGGAIRQEASHPSVIASPTEQYLTIHYAQRLDNSAADCNRWQVVTLTLYNADAYVVCQWHNALEDMLRNSSRCRVQRLLIFVNPYGGRKQGLQMYEKHCRPIFQLANVDVSCVVSQRANQIRDILMSHDLSLYDAVCCVGGDGTVAEVINGLIFRAMLDNNASEDAGEFIPKPALPIGIIPAGSTDTIAYTLHGTADVRTAAIHVVLGQVRGLDVCSVRNRQGILRFCTSVLSYGYLGDVAAKSERYRWMGTKRYEYTGVKAFLMNKGYEAEIRILEADGDAEDDEPLLSTCHENCRRCSTATTEADLQRRLRPSMATGGCDTHNGKRERLPLASPKGKEAGVKVTAAADCDELDRKIDCDMVTSIENEEAIRGTGCGTPAYSTLPAMDKLKQGSGTAPEAANSAVNSNLVQESGKWKVIKGEFFMISGANIACACTRSPHGIARNCHSGDGYLNLILVRKTSLINNVRFLLNTIQRNGDICSLPFVEAYRTKKFHFRSQSATSEDRMDDYSITGSCQPIAEAYNNGDADEFHERVSSWNCDGEVVNDLDIVMSCHCQIVDVLMRGPHIYNSMPAPMANSNPNSNFCCNTSSTSE